MPELPEVESYARYFARHALKQRIQRVEILDERILGLTGPEALRRALRGREFARVMRHGKHLFAECTSEGLPPVWLHLHFGMSGDLHYFSDGAVPRFARLLFHFQGGATLAFEDMRLFGLVELSADPPTYVSERGLGPDPLASGFTIKKFRQILRGRRGAIKSLLMSQEIIAGVGNLYADEVLFQTGIHPRRSVEKLRDEEIRSLYVTLRKILRQVIARQERGRGHPRRYLIPLREEGERCPLCRGTIQRTVVFGRTTYFCGRHQR